MHRVRSNMLESIINRFVQISHRLLEMSEINDNFAYPRRIKLHILTMKEHHFSPALSVLNFAQFHTGLICRSERKRSVGLLSCDTPNTDRARTCLLALVSYITAARVELPDESWGPVGKPLL